MRLSPYEMSVQKNFQPKLLSKYHVFFNKNYQYTDCVKIDFFSIETGIFNLFYEVGN